MPTKLTITEALAEIKTISKRLEKKRAFSITLLWRQERLRDPMEKDGGSRNVLSAEMQSILDLERRIVKIRAAISAANQITTLTIGGETQTVQNWLSWRREVVAGQQAHLSQIARTLTEVRSQAAKKQVNVISGGETQSLDDVIINIDELAIRKRIEQIEEILGALDGQLSLLNATTTVTIMD